VADVRAQRENKGRRKAACRDAMVHRLYALEAWNLGYPNSDASYWVGLGGQDDSHELIQVGVEEHFDGSSFSFTPFIEAYPYNNEVPVSLPQGINCDDTIDVSVGSQPGVAGSDEFMLADERTGNWFSTAEPDWPPISAASSAEWITELPSTRVNDQTTLDSALLWFGRMTFSYAPDVGENDWHGICGQPGTCEGGRGPMGTAGDWPNTAASMYSQSNTDSNGFARSMAISSGVLGHTSLADEFTPAGYADNSEFYVDWANPN
jgi:hypothetical protein